MELERERTACFTGHREIKEDIGALHREIWNTVCFLYSEKGITDYIIGGALGFDTLAAEVIHEINIKHPKSQIRYHIYIPCPEQTKGWQQADIAKYNELLKGAASTVTVSPKYTSDCMLKRNRAMVDASSLCIAYCYNTARSGTAATVRYAVSSGMRVMFLPKNCGMTEESFRR